MWGVHIQGVSGVHIQGVSGACIQGVSGACVQGVSGACIQGVSGACIQGVHVGVELLSVGGAHPGGEWGAHPGGEWGVRPGVELLSVGGVHTGGGTTGADTQNAGGGSFHLGSGVQFYPTRAIFQTTAGKVECEAGVMAGVVLLSVCVCVMFVCVCVCLCVFEGRCLTGDFDLGLNPAPPQIRNCFLPYTNTSVFVLLNLVSWTVSE